jgi:hypothetical protein
MFAKRFLFVEGENAAPEKASPKGPEGWAVLLQIQGYSIYGEHFG